MGLLQTRHRGERMSEFEDISIEAPKLKRDTESNEKNRTGIQEL